MKIVDLYKFNDKKFEVSLYDGDQEELAQGQGEVDETLETFDNYDDAKQYADDLAFKYCCDIVEN